MPAPSSPGLRVALRIEQDTPCPDCGYNLRGLRLDSRCPECGRPTIDTFARPLRASTGVLAEQMMRRSGRLLLVLLGWWSGYRWVAWYLPPAAGRLVLLALTLAAAFLLLAGLAEALRIRRQVSARGGSSAKPLREASLPWLILWLLGAAAGGALMTLAWLDGEPSLLVQTVLILGASASALGSQLLAGQAAMTVLRRLAMAPVMTPLLVAGGCALVLIGAAIAPALDAPLLNLARGAAAAVALLGWLIGSYLVIARLQEAQGPVVSLGRRPRR